MHISYLTDEAHDDFAKALELGRQWGLRYAEVRTIDGVNVMDCTDEQIARAKRLLDDHGMTVSAVATPFLKCTIPGQTGAQAGPMHGARQLTYEEHLALLKRGVQLAKAFGTDKIRIFSFWRQDGVDFWGRLEEAVAATLEAVAGTGVTPCLENEGACFIGTSQELAQAAERLTDPRLKFIWDPGNSTYSGMPPREEDFAKFINRVGLIHIKDARYDAAQGKYVPALVGQGETNYAAELKRISAHYKGVLTLEPHYKPGNDLTEGMRQSVEALRALAAEVGITLG